MELTCPKCQGTMRAYERNGITIDQCGECRGVFLDRGELERLIDAEAAWSASAAPPAPRQASPAYGTPPAAAPPVPGRRDEQYPQEQYRSYDQHYDPRYDQRRDYDSDRTPYPRGGYQKKRKRSFLEDLFD